MNQVAIKFKSFLQSFLEIPREQLILKFALFFVLSFTKSVWSLHIPLRILALYMLLDHRFTSKKALWWIITIGHLAIIGLEWDTIDNHKFLSFYWILTCTLSLYFEGAQEQLRMLAFNAQILIGLCFSFATMWKIWGGQFLDGTFFHFTFLTDRRFEFGVGYITDITRDILPKNREILHGMYIFPQINSHAFLSSPSFIRTMALYVSWWTILIEGLVSFSFMVPAKWAIHRIRHIFLLIFILSTYTFVPVAGFNYILVLLGLSNLKIDERKWAWTYLVALFISEIKQMPFLEYSLHIYRYFHS